MRIRRDTEIERGFTLIELLVVITIMAILGGLLLTGIIAAMRMAKKAEAQNEIMSIRDAVERYYEEYGQYPNPSGVPDSVLEGVGIPVAGDLADLLRGQNVNGRNPRKLQFMSFTRGGTNGVPVNPWAPTDGTSYDTVLGMYWCKFDTDFNKLIDGTGDPDNMMQPENDVRKSVIVWTYRFDPDSGDLYEVVKSWQ